MRVINFVLALFTFAIGWWTMVGVTAAVCIAILCFFSDVHDMANTILPKGGLVAMIVPVTFCVFLGLSSMDYAKYLIKLCVKK